MSPPASSRSQSNRKPPAATPAQELDAFIERYTPDVAASARTILARMRERLPGAIELVYDNYNALAIGFARGERVSDVIFSIALYPKWVNLFFFAGDALYDPEKLLEGSGKLVRHIKLRDPRLIDDERVVALMHQALALAGGAFSGETPARTIIKSVSANQRPRRPAGKTAN